MALTRQELEGHKRKILGGLVDFFYEVGYASEAYRDEATGGIYEHKLANRLGYQLAADNKPPAEFDIAVKLLEAEGLIVRTQRNPDFPVKGIWPTRAGLNLVDYWRLPWYRKGLTWLQSQLTLSLVVSCAALLVSLAGFLYRDVLLWPKVVYKVTEFTEYPRTSQGLSLAVKRAEAPGLVQLKYGVLVHIRNAGWRTASEIEIRATVGGGAFIVQVHADNSRLVRRLPDIGRQGTQEVFLTIPRMVPNEETELTFWYGIPNLPETKPPLPTVLVSHADGLGQLVN